MSVSSRGTGLLPVLAAVGAASLWGTTGTAQALGPDGTDPVVVGAFRLLVGAVVLQVVAAITTRRRAGAGALVPPEVPTRSSRSLPDLAVVALGGIAVAAYQACFFVGVSRAGVAVGTVVALGVAPLATGALGLLLGERPDRRWMVATLGAVTGVVLLVVGSGSGSQGPDVLGIAAAAGAGASYAGYTIAARALLMRGRPGTGVMAGLFTLGALLCVPVLFVADLTWLATAPGLGMVLWLGVVATGLSYVFFQYGLTSLTAGVVATLSLAEPLTATLLGVVVLGERLSALTLVGMAVVVASLVLAVVKPRSGRLGP